MEEPMIYMGLQSGSILKEDTVTKKAQNYDKPLLPSPGVHPVYVQTYSTN